MHVIEASSFQLETTDDVPPVDRRAPQLLARSPRSPPSSRLRRGQGAHLRQPAADDWAVVNADDRGGRRLVRQTRARWCASRARRHRRRRAVEGGAIVWQRTSDGEDGAGAARCGAAARAATCSPTSSPPPASADLSGVPARRSRARRKDPRARARAGAGGDDRRRAVRQRLEGDQHRCAARSSRASTRRGRDHRRQVQGRRHRATSREPLRGAGRAVVAIGEARPLLREALRRWCRSRGQHGRRGASGRGRSPRRRHGAARAGVRELRHVRRLRRARARLQGRGRAIVRVDRSEKGAAPCADEVRT